MPPWLSRRWVLKSRRTKIGDTWVSEELKKGGDFGGETSGAWIFPSISLCPDGIYRRGAGGGYRRQTQAFGAGGCRAGLSACARQREQ